MPVASSRRFAGARPRSRRRASRSRRAARAAGGAPAPATSTGSIAGSGSRERAAAGEWRWRAEAERWGKRYDANPKDPDAGLRLCPGAARPRPARAGARRAAAGVAGPPQRPRAARRLWPRAGRYRRLKEADEVLSRAHTPERPDWRILSAQGTVPTSSASTPGAALYASGAQDRAGRTDRAVQSRPVLALVEAPARGRARCGAPPRSRRADARVRQNLVLVLGLQGRFAEAETHGPRRPAPERGRRQRRLSARSAQPAEHWRRRRHGARRRRGARSR